MSQGYFGHAKSFKDILVKDFKVISVTNQYDNLTVNKNILRNEHFTKIWYYVNHEKRYTL